MAQDKFSYPCKYQDASPGGSLQTFTLSSFLDLTFHFLHNGIDLGHFYLGFCLYLALPSACCQQGFLQRILILLALAEVWRLLAFAFLPSSLLVPVNHLISVSFCLEPAEGAASVVELARVALEEVLPASRMKLPESTAGDLHG